MSNNNQKNFGLINLDTGEVRTDGFSFQTDEQKARYKNKKKQYKNKNPYYWIKYTLNKKLFNSKISGSTLTRYIYLCTFMGYDNYIMLYSRKATIKELQSILRIGRTQTYNFVKECLENKLIYVDNEFIRINKRYIFRGRIKNSDLHENNLTRLYIQAIRYLYENSNARYHKTLSYLFALIPLCNRKYNIICSNPLESNSDKLETLSLLDISEFLGYEKSNICKLKSKLKQIEINGVPAICFTESKEKETIIINPDIYHAGNNFGEIKVLGNFF